MLSTESTAQCPDLQGASLCLQVLQLGAFLDHPNRVRGPVSFVLPRPNQGAGAKPTKKKAALQLASKLHPVTHIVAINLYQ